MKFIVSILVTSLLAFAGGLYMPWWSVVLASCIVALLIAQRAWRSFFSGFLAIFILWGALAWKINIANEGILAPKMAEILPFGGSVSLLLLVTALTGGIAGGLGALTGHHLLRVFRKI